MNSSHERLTKAAWFQSQTYYYSASPLKLQKFLFFYEMFSKVNEEDYSLYALKAYPNGPVFSNTYGDLRYNTHEFQEKMKLITDFSLINNKIAEAALFLVNTFTDTEISDLTHQFDLWKSKEDKINKGERNIPITDNDITQEDIGKLSSIYKEYSYLASEGYKVFSMLEKIFIISPENYNNLREAHHEVIEILSQDDNLDNPVYLDLEDGVLLID